MPSRPPWNRRGAGCFPWFPKGKAWRWSCTGRRRSVGRLGLRGDDGPGDEVKQDACSLEQAEDGPRQADKGGVHPEVLRQAAANPAQHAVLFGTIQTTQFLPPPWDDLTVGFPGTYYDITVARLGADEHPPGLRPEMGAAGPDQVPARGAQGARLELQMGQVHLDASQAGGGVDVVADVAGGDDGDADAGMGGAQVDVGPGAGDVLQVQLDAAVAGAGPHVAPPAGQLDAAVGGAEGAPGAT